MNAELIAIRLPDFGAGEDSIRFSCWLVDLGDSIVAGDRIAEVLIPGASFDVSSPADGRLAKVEAVVGDNVEVGDVIGWIAPEESLEVGN